MQRAGLWGRRKCSEPPALPRLDPGLHLGGRRESGVGLLPRGRRDEGRKMRSWGKRASLAYNQTPTTRDTGEPHAQACGRAALGRGTRRGLSGQPAGLSGQQGGDMRHL